MPLYLEAVTEWERKNPDLACLGRDMCILDKTYPQKPKVGIFLSEDEKHELFVKTLKKYNHDRRVIAEAQREDKKKMKAHKKANPKHSPTHLPEMNPITGQMHD